MVCKITSIKSPHRGRRVGAALLEAVFAIGITGLLMIVVATVSMVSSRNFAVFANYVELNDANRLAMDRITRDLRECNRITSCTTNRLTMEDSDGFTITYQHNASAKTLTRAKNGISKTILTGCDSMQFHLMQRNPVGGSYDVYPAATPATAKVVDVAWNCSRTILGIKANTENVQTARIVIRRQRS